MSSSTQDGSILLRKLTWRTYGEDCKAVEVVWLMIMRRMGVIQIVQTT